jgi:hypothetical protein
MTARERQLILLAYTLRLIHHRRYMSLRWVKPPWWAFWRRPELRDEVGNIYQEIP